MRQTNVLANRGFRLYMRKSLNPEVHTSSYELAKMCAMKTKENNKGK